LTLTDPSDSIGQADALPDTPIAGRPAGAGAELSVSFEFFPPTDPEMESVLWASVRRLEVLESRFVSVTYGADGSTRDRTREVVTRLTRDTQLTVAPHIGRAESAT